MAHKAPRTAWKKGQSGNPKGRPPKGYSITEWFKQMLKSNPDVKEAIGKSITEKAVAGDTAAQKLIWQYMDGLPTQPVDHTTGGQPIIFNVTRGKEKND